MALTRSRAKAIRSLANKKYRDELGAFVVEGLRLMKDAVDSDFEILEAFHTAEFTKDAAAKAVLEKLQAKCRRVDQVSEREMEHLADSVNAQGVLAVLRQKRALAASLLDRRDPPPVLVALDGVADPGNLGSIVRTCDWFGVDGVLLGEHCVDLYNPKVVRATMGGLFHLPISEEVDLLPAITQAKNKGYTVYITDPAGETHFDRVRFTRPSLIAFGNEAWGISDQIRKFADVRVAIRRYGMAESLNVAVACGVVLSGLHRLMVE